MVKTRRLKEVISEESVIPQNFCYCRKCQKVKRSSFFFKAVDLEIDQSGFFSICKECTDELYKKALEAEYGSVQKAVLYLCRKLNVKYSDEAIDAATKQIQSSNWNPDKFFGVYRAKLLAVGKSQFGASTGLEYEDNPTIIMNEDYNNDEEGFTEEDYNRLKSFWGTTYSQDEMAVLEGKYMRWSESHSINTESERVLLKLICIKEFEIDKAIAGNSSTTILLKEFQELLKTSGLNPSSAVAAGTNKSQETWGNFVKMVEETEPAEFYKDDSLFKDFDNINEYWQKFVVRSIKNFITGSKDFNLESSADDYEDDNFTDEEPVVPLEYSVDNAEEGEKNGDT